MKDLFFHSFGAIIERNSDPLSSKYK